MNIRLPILKLFPIALLVWVVVVTPNRVVPVTGDMVPPTVVILNSFTLLEPNPLNDTLVHHTLLGPGGLLLPARTSRLSRHLGPHLGQTLQPPVQQRVTIHRRPMLLIPLTHRPSPLLRTTNPLTMP